MPGRLIMVNGGSSAGKSEIVRCLQDVLPDPWLAFGVDRLIEAMPAWMQTADGGLELAADGSVGVGPLFRRLETAWAHGVAETARAGASVIVDDVLLGGATAQERWRRTLAGLDVLWVGVRCDPDVAAAREAARGDRITGMAATQAELVHRGVAYDVEVDTTRTTSKACAHRIVQHLR